MTLTEQLFTIDIDSSQLVFRFSHYYEPTLHGIAWVQQIQQAIVPNTRSIVLDFVDFDRIDSRIYTALIQVQRHANAQGIATIVITNPGPRLLRGLDLLRLTPFFQIDRDQHLSPSM